jgi:GAF domain-containing protein
VQTLDYTEEQAYKERDPVAVAMVELGGVRTLIAVPMLKESAPIGAISIFRQEVRPFTEKQIALVQNFAAQAVIAIENARLLNELRQRTTDLTERTIDLTEALEQQTATSEVLQVISSSPGELEPVFAAILASATRICEAKFGNLFLRDGEAFRAVAWHGEPTYVENWQGEALIIKTDVADIPLARLAATKQRVHVADLRQEAAYKEGFAPLVSLVDKGRARTILLVPMLKERTLVGAVTLYRQKVRPFTDKQIALVENFAAQAVIAIENARLLNELRQSLEQQTATSQILQVISSSPGNLKEVFATILENATRICEAKFGALYLNEGDGFRATAMHNAPPAYEEARAAVVHPPPSTTLWRAANTKQAVQIDDVMLERGYIEGDPFNVSAVALGGYRSVFSVPMLHEDKLVGVITIFRQEVRPFTQEQISLVQSFAAQAVIAMENARLLSELRERTQQLETQSQEVVKLNQQLELRVTDQVGEIERMGRLRRFLPPQVADLIVASGTEKQLESHRREITALFCDLRGFTGFSESADPEDVIALLRDYHAAVGEKIVKYSGTLERYAGDGVMVVFNDPVPVENPALQAVLMALEMRDAIGALTETWRRWGHDIGFGIGIAHGFATLGTIGFEGRFDYAAIGTVSNVASRLCDEAKPGQILISPRVLTKVENAVKVEPVGEFELKGIRRPLAAYNVVAAATRQI